MERLSISFEKTMHDWLHEAAEVYGISVGEFIRRAFRREKALWEQPDASDDDSHILSPAEYELLVAVRRVLAERAG